MLGQLHHDPNVNSIPHLGPWALPPLAKRRFRAHTLSMMTGALFVMAWLATAPARAELRAASAVECGTLSTAAGLRAVLTRQYCGGVQELWDASRCVDYAGRRGFAREFPHIILAADLARYTQGGVSQGVSTRIHERMVDLALDRLLAGGSEPSGCRAAARSAYSRSARGQAEDADSVLRRAALLQLLWGAGGPDVPELQALLTQALLTHRTMGMAGCEWKSGLRRFDPVLGPPTGPCGPVPSLSGAFGLEPVLPATLRPLTWSEAGAQRDAVRAGALSAYITEHATGYASYCYRAVKAAMIAAGLLPVADGSQTGRIGIDPGDAYKLAEALSEAPGSEERMDLTKLRGVDPRNIPWLSRGGQTPADLEGLIVVYDRSPDCDYHFSQESGHVEVITRCDTGFCPRDGVAMIAWNNTSVDGPMLCSDGCSRRPWTFFDQAAKKREGCLSVFVPVRDIQAPTPY